MPNKTLPPRNLMEAAAELCRQIEISGAVDDHGHDMRNLKALADVRTLLPKTSCADCGAAIDNYRPGDLFCSPCNKKPEETT